MSTSFAPDSMTTVPEPTLRGLDAVTVPAPELEAALKFYRDGLGHEVIWRHATGAGLRVPDSEAELVLTTEHQLEPNWLVTSVEGAAARCLVNGGSVVEEPFDIPVGRPAVVIDPFGNPLVLISLHRRYLTDIHGTVTGVTAAAVGDDRSARRTAPYRCAGVPSRPLVLDAVERSRRRRTRRPPRRRTSRRRRPT